jgi:hypothetical protein
VSSFSVSRDLPFWTTHEQSIFGNLQIERLDFFGANELASLPKRRDWLIWTNEIASLHKRRLDFFGPMRVVHLLGGPSTDW